MAGRDYAPVRTGDEDSHGLEWFRRPAINPDRSVADFVRDHFGAEAVEHLAQPMVAGVYGSPPESLSAEHVLPHFVEYERRYGSILRGTLKHRKNRASGPLFLTLRDGMRSLIETLRRRVASTCEVRPDEVQELRRIRDGWHLGLRDGSDSAQSVVIATPAHEAARLRAAQNSGLAGLLHGIGYTSSVVAALVYAKPGFRHTLNGFGMLFRNSGQVRHKPDSAFRLQTMPSITLDSQQVRATRSKSQSV